MSGFLEERQYCEMMEESEFDDLLVFTNVYTRDELRRMEARQYVACALSQNDVLLEIRDEGVQGSERALRVKVIEDFARQIDEYSHRVQLGQHNLHNFIIESFLKGVNCGNIKLRERPSTAGIRPRGISFTLELSGSKDSENRSMTVIRVLDLKGLSMLESKK